jgi:hypothetical protein
MHLPTHAVIATTRNVPSRSKRQNEPLRKALNFSVASIDHSVLAGCADNGRLHSSFVISNSLAK